MRFILLALVGLQAVCTSLAHGPVHGQIAELDAQVAANPSDPGLWVQRADLWRLDGDHGRAWRDLETAAGLAPELDQVWWVRARLLAEPFPTAEALPDLDRWLARHPGHGAALELRARVRESAGDLSGAVSDLTQALAVMDAPAPDPYLTRARIQRQMGPVHWEEALHGLEEGLGRLGPLVALHLEAMGVEQVLGRTNAALNRLDLLAARAANPASWHARKARLLSSAGRESEAEVAWAEVLASGLRRSGARRRTPANVGLEAEARSRLPAVTVARIEREAAEALKLASQVAADQARTEAPVRVRLKAEP